MKRIFFNRNGRVKNPYFPFWQPWGCMGCLWRVIVFFVGLVLLLWLISTMFRGCARRLNPYTPPQELIDSLDNGRVEWGKPIEGVGELPPPENNRIPPVDPDDLITDPVDSIGEVVKDQLIAFFNSKQLDADMTSFARQFKKAYPSADYSIIYYNNEAGTMLLQVPAERLVELLNEIPTKVTGIDYILTTNYTLSYQMEPTDPGFKKSDYRQYFEAIQAFEAWDITTGDPGVKVAVVDSYFCLDHPEINNRWVDPINIVQRNRDVFPHMPITNETKGLAYHGSHVTGIAVGAMNNNGGVAGIAPNCTWIPISVGDSMSSLNIIEGILYGIYHGADVVNISLGRSFPKGLDKVLPIETQEMIARESCKRFEQVWDYIYKVATDRRCVIVTAAGNENIIMGLDPGKRDKDIVKVEALSSTVKKSDFSNFGKVPNSSVEYSTVSAPGVGILSCVSNNSYEPWPGTSMASPIVAGAVALMKSIDKSLSAAEIIRILQETGKPLPPQECVGPMIQIKDALEMVKKNMLSYEDVLKDPTKLIGQWEATKSLDLTTVDDEFLDKLYLTMTFDTVKSGVLEMKATESQRLYRADLKVSMGQTIEITQLKDAVSSDGHKITKDDFICKPDKDGLLLVEVMRNGQKRFDFNMRKVIKNK